jgi:hypothetical protein
MVALRQSGCDIEDYYTGIPRMSREPLEPLEPLAAYRSRKCDRTMPLTAGNIAEYPPGDTQI